MFYLHSSASCFSLPLPPAFTPQLFCHLLNCRTDPLFSRSNLIFTISLQSLAQSFTFWPQCSPSCWLHVVICSSQESCCCLPSVLFALAHLLVMLFSDPHQVLSNSHFSPDADVLWAHRPNLHTLSQTTPRVNTSVTRCCLESVAASYKPALEVGFTRTR